MVEKLAALLVHRAEANRAGFLTEVFFANAQLFPLMARASEEEVEDAISRAASILCPTPCVCDLCSGPHARSYKVIGGGDTMLCGDCASEHGIRIGLVGTEHC